MIVLINPSKDALQTTFSVFPLRLDKVVAVLFSSCLPFSSSQKSLLSSNSIIHHDENRWMSFTRTAPETSRAVTDLQRRVESGLDKEFCQSLSRVTRTIQPPCRAITSPHATGRSYDVGFALGAKVEEKEEAAIGNTGGEGRAVSLGPQQIECSQVDEACPSEPVSSSISRQPTGSTPSTLDTDSNAAFPSAGEHVLPNSTCAERRAEPNTSLINNNRPSLVRKKSGELVRPALRVAQPLHRRSSSPSSKTVHFNSELEQIQHFRKVDRPRALSDGSSSSSSADNCLREDLEHVLDDDDDDDDGDDEPSFHRSNDRDGPPWLQHRWEARLINFPQRTSRTKSITRGAATTTPVVRLESLLLSTHKKQMTGTVAVQNLAFQKLVVARYTFDCWNTISETTAEYHDLGQDAGASDGLDRFDFTIDFADQVALVNKRLLFCIRYAVNGTEYWDNNSNRNYEIYFARKSAMIPRRGHGA